jgi:lysophospholipase L1-like esterase
MSLIDVGKYNRSMSRRWLVGLAMLAALVLACDAGGRAGSGNTGDVTPVPGFPSSMVALGDSITAAFGSCLAPISCPRNSWSTGDGTQVLSHYRRIVDANPAMAGHARNLAERGATAADLRSQATAAASTPVDYVTILIGANDACPVDMTTVANFRASVDAALATLKRAMPEARVLIVSLPDIYRVWELGHTNQLAGRVWKGGSICPSLLAAATSSAPADAERREVFRDRVAAYNVELREACEDYGARCRYADVSGFAFDLTMLSGIEFFHPNASGQEALAGATFPNAFSW